MFSENKITNIFVKYKISNTDTVTLLQRLSFSKACMCCYYSS